MFVQGALASLTLVRTQTCVGYISNRAGCVSVSVLGRGVHLDSELQVVGLEIESQNEFLNSKHQIQKRRKRKQKSNTAVRVQFFKSKIKNHKSKTVVRLAARSKSKIKS